MRSVLVVWEYRAAVGCAVGLGQGAVVDAASGTWGWCCPRRVLSVPSPALSGGHMGDEVTAFTSQRRQRVHDGRARVIIVGVVAFIAATFGLALPASAAPPIKAVTTTAPLSTAPVYTGDFPDPSVVLDGSTYYAFATQGNGAAVQRLTSPDRLHWNRTAQPDALLAVPAWADTLGTWAPEVQHVGAQYVMYYTVHMRNSVECVSIAMSVSPALQFVDHSSAPLICRVPGGGSIDPSPFLSPTGERFLTWKSNLNGASTLFARKMTADGTSFAPGNQAKLLQSTAVAWAPSNIEGPSMVFHDGKYLLFYSGNVYTSPAYGIGYAVCATPLGPCTNSSTTAPWVGTHGDARGPGGQSFFTDTTGTLVMAYHAWGQAVGYENGGVRAFWTDTVHFTGGVPTLG
jgi:beta-xylosidase